MARVQTRRSKRSDDDDEVAEVVTGGGGEMGVTPGVSRVPRASLAALLTCPLCKSYFREASAFVQCGHTFCRECIMKKIYDEEIESCPVCDVALGIAPEEKLRSDKRLQAIRNKVFPPETEVDASEAPTLKLPANIKERPISSLVDIQKMATQSTLNEWGTKAARTITIDREELQMPLQSLVIASAKKSRKSRSRLRKSSEADLPDRITTPVWFSLVTSPNRVQAKLLPQLEKNFYRIKDGTMQVSAILKLITKKLELASDDQVEILCNGRPVCHSTTLHDLLKRWLRGKPKNKIQKPVGIPANEFVMELRYRRCPASRSIYAGKSRPTPSPAIATPKPV